MSIVVHSVIPCEEDERATAFDVSPLPSPEETGSLSAAEIRTLYKIAIYPAQKWKISGQGVFDEVEFTGFVNCKTQQAPSYLVAYRETLALYSKLEKELGADAAMNYLYAPSEDMPPEYWDVVRDWVLQEYLILFISSRRFRPYEWIDFPGWMGVSRDDSDKLAYRRIDID